MKIQVIRAEHRLPITIRLPLRAVRLKLFWKLSLKFCSPEERERLLKYQLVISECSLVLEKYVKENGHFTLVEIKDSEGSLIKIIL